MGCPPLVADEDGSLVAKGNKGTCSHGEGDVDSHYSVAKTSREFLRLSK